MAIALEFVNVIARKSAVAARFPGGLDGFARQDLANYLEDEHILRVGFMSTGDALRFTDELERAGLRFTGDAASDLVVFYDDPPAESWLAMGIVEGCGACWLRGQPPGRLVKIDPTMMVRCRVLRSVDDVANALRKGGAEVRVGAPVEPETAMLECERAGAQVQVFVIHDGGQALGAFGRRILARRTSIAVDVALMCELMLVLNRAEGLAE